jgi:HSP20 family protein
MNNLIQLDPFADAAFDNLFRGVFRPLRAEPAPAPIKLDVAEQDGAYVVRAEIPGVGKDDIQVSIEGSQVTIGAEVKREFGAGEGQRLLHSERHFGSVRRSFTLPVEIDEATSAAKYQNGVLLLTLAKKAAPAGRKLAIQ